jgi:response regulator RpfG family c-di-GMP phosphodiesterase
MRMPEMDGARLLEQVKARWPEVARILLTGYADLNSTVAAINRAEIYRYIAKPWDDAVVLRVVADALERKMLAREKTRLEELTQRQNEQLKELNTSLESKVRDRTAELARALEALEQAHEKLKKSFTTSIKVFANLIELHEGSRAGHSRHVAESAQKLAQRMHLPDADMQSVMLAGLLHGIGEFGVPDEVLRKPLAALTTEERSKVVKQPLRAQAALIGLQELTGAGKVIRSYRERFDGSGYPDALRGSAIPIGASILAVAHDYEAAQEGTLTGRWLSKLEAREFIVANRQKRYAPAVVDAFVEMLDEVGVKPRAEVVLSAGALKDAMVLTRDLLTAEGILLLSKDTSLDAGLIEKLCRYESRQEIKLQVHVRVQ